MDELASLRSGVFLVVGLHEYSLLGIFFVISELNSSSTCIHFTGLAVRPELFVCRCKLGMSHVFASYR